MGTLMTGIQLTNLQGSKHPNANGRRQQSDSGSKSRTQGCRHGSLWTNRKALSPSILPRWWAAFYICTSKLADCLEHIQPSVPMGCKNGLPPSQYGHYISTPPRRNIQINIRNWRTYIYDNKSKIRKPAPMLATASSMPSCVELDPVHPVV